MTTAGWSGHGRRRSPAFDGAASALQESTWAASLYELPPGQATFPYHYELGNDELLVVVTGRPTLRTPEGERELEPGDCILFPSGPQGAHQLMNRTGEAAHILLASNFAMPRAAVQPDSAKMMIRWGADERQWFPLEAAADYWEGEAE